MLTLILLAALPSSPLLAAGAFGVVGVLGGALALGIRHGIDWDHIAAITDITSSTAPAADDRSEWLAHEPGLMLTDESHHSMSRLHPVAVGAGAATTTVQPSVAAPPARANSAGRLFHRNREAIWLGTLYAFGHGTVVAVLGLVAIIASQFLPEWVDPIMERVVGVTLIFLAAYLFFSIFRFFRGGDEFRMRSRWMLMFAGVQRLWHWTASRFHGHEHPHVEQISPDRYGPVTAYSIGLVHGIGAETGTQVLVIATAVGAGSKAAGVAALFAFVVGLIISNSVVTVTTAFGFVSSQRRQWIYIVVGLVAGVFSLLLGLMFLFNVGFELPSLDPYFRWIGGPEN